MDIYFQEVGKTQNYKYAKDFAKAILCLEDNGNACDKCRSCLMFNENNHSGYYEINKDENDSIKIDEIRQMQAKVIEKPIISNRKVYLINNADTMTKEAQNSLLKTLEEPPDFVTMILVTNNENSILTTIKSRCTKILFTETSIDELTEEDKEKYDELEKIFGNVEKHKSVELLNKLDILYKDKEGIFNNLAFINMIFFDKLKKDASYAEYITYVEDTKRKLKANSNFDMCIDYLILKIWE